jgi:hypothetical protein
MRRFAQLCNDAGGWFCSSERTYAEADSGTHA